MPVGHSRTLFAVAGFFLPSCRHVCRRSDHLHSVMRGQLQRTSALCARIQDAVMVSAARDHGAMWLGEPERATRCAGVPRWSRRNRARPCRTPWAAGARIPSAGCSASLHNLSDSIIILPEL
jgi:hypothetical protein